MDADIFEEIRRLRQEGRKAVLATIVQIRGSVPSFQTAKMLVSKIAMIVDFRTTFEDNRSVFANAERFPEAVAIYSDTFEKAFAAITPTENTYLVIVTRGHQEDENLLRWAVGTNARHIGMI